MSNNLNLRKYSRVLARPELPYFLIIWSTIFLCALGLTMVLSSSTVTSLQESGNTYSIFIKQFFFLILGSFATFWAFRVKGTIWPFIARYALSISIVILFQLYNFLEHWFWYRRPHRLSYLLRPIGLYNPYSIHLHLLNT